MALKKRGCGQFYMGLCVCVYVLCVYLCALWGRGVGEILCRECIP